MSFRTWMWPLLLAGCGTLTYYEKDMGPDAIGDDDDTITGDDDDATGDDDTTGDDDDNHAGDDDDTTITGDDDDNHAGDDDDTTTTTTDVCLYPSVPITAVTATAAMPTPSYLGVNFIGHIVGDEIYDYTVNGTSENSSKLVFSFFDLYLNFMCDVYYDASGAIPTSGWTTDSGAVLWASFDVPLSGGDSICGSINSGGYTDLRDWLEDQNWGFGVGEMRGMEGDLSAYVNSLGDDWATNWDPYTYSIYITGGPFAASGEAVEASWAQSLEHDCEDVTLDVDNQGTLLSPPTGAPLDDFVNSGSWNLYYILSE